MLPSLILIIACLLPGQSQNIIWTDAAISLIKPLETNFNEILIEIHIFSFKKLHLKIKMSVILSQSQCVKEYQSQGMMQDTKTY